MGKLIDIDRLSRFKDKLLPLINKKSNIEGIAIVSNNNTHAAASTGQFVYVYNHSSLTEGLYKAKSAIATNATLSSSNLSSVSNGGLNSLMSEVSSLRSIFTRQIRQYTNITIPDYGYIKIDSYSDMGISQSKYLLSITPRGWSGNIENITFIKSSVGTDVYMVGPPNKTITSISVEYVFSDI